MDGNSHMNRCRRALVLAAIGMAMASVMGTARAADHLDTPSVIADPAADIGDLFAWMAPDGRRLNLVMAIVAHRFSDRLLYVLHVDSGTRFGATTATTTIACRFGVDGAVECWAGEADHARGAASEPAGLAGRNGRFRIFAGLRDDPFFNNVKGSRAALDVAAAALRAGTDRDPAGCPRFGSETSRQILDRWQRTGDGPGTNFLAGWTPASLVISVDLDIVAPGGPLLAVWGAVHELAGDTDGSSAPAVASGSEPSRARIPAPPIPGAQIERMGRALTANALLGLFADAGVSNRLKEEYNRAGQADWPRFTDEIERGLALYDGFDGRCGNQWLAAPAAEPRAPYRRLARLLADDRLWIDAAAIVCNRYLGIELAADADADCGGRTPNHDAVDVFRSLLVMGAREGVADGVDRDERVHSIGEFPFLASP